MCARRSAFAIMRISSVTAAYSRRAHPPISSQTNPCAAFIWESILRCRFYSIFPVLPYFACICEITSDGMEHPNASHFKACASIHRPLKVFQPIDLSFDSAIAIGPLERHAPADAWQIFYLTPVMTMNLPADRMANSTTGAGLLAPQAHNPPTANPLPTFDEHPRQFSHCADKGEHINRTSRQNPGRTIQGVCAYQALHAK